MGRFITRVRPGDKELNARLVEEARRCYAADVPMSETLALLLELAGDNPNAFRFIGGKDTRGLTRTPEGQAILRVLGMAASTMEGRTRVGVPRVVGMGRTPEEKRLASMPVEDAFNLLAQQEPALLEAAQDVVLAAETARGRCDGYADVRAAVDEVVGRTLRMVGPTATAHNGLVATKTASLVVMYHMYQITGVSVFDLKCKGWPGGT